MHRGEGKRQRERERVGKKDKEEKREIDRDIYREGEAEGGGKEIHAFGVNVWRIA